MAVGDPGIDAFHLLCERIWNTETIPANLGKAVIMPIKKDKMDCSNYRDQPALPPREDTYIILLSEEQAGFHPGRGTVDQLLTLHQILESRIEKRKELYMPSTLKRHFKIECGKPA